MLNRKTAIATAALAGSFLALRGAIRRSRRISLRGRTVLITGGSRGLGLALARQFAFEGARVAICARDEAELSRARSQLISHGVDVFAVQCDVTIPEQVEALVRAVSHHFGAIDVLVNNAGTISVGPMQTMTIDDFEQAMRLHFWAPLYLTQAVLPQMKQRREGRIVNIASIGGKISVPHLLPYSASKFALVGYSEGLRSELAKDKIRVTTVCPGLMRTGSPRNASFKGRHRAEYAWFVIADSLPLASIASRRAARQIIRACQEGRAELILSLAAKIAVKFHGLFPGMTADMNAIVQRMLPGAGGIGTRRAHGWQSQSAASESLITGLNRSAEVENNQLRPAIL